MTLEYLIHHVITLKPHHRPTGNTRHPSGTISDEGELIRGPELPQPHALMIAQLLPDPGYLLLCLDEDGEEITDTYHESWRRHSTKPIGSLITDLQKQINARWYHLTVDDGEITEHYEISKPNSLAHKLNFTEPWRRPSDEECERRKMGSMPGGGQVPETKPKPKPKPRPRPRPRPTPNNGRKPCCL